MRKSAFGMVAFLLSATVFCSFSSLRQAWASDGTVYIRADGSVEGTSLVESSDNVTYVLTADLNDSVVVERSNITIDGNGHTLNGSGLAGATGFRLAYVKNVTIKKVNVRGLGTGIDISQSQGIIIVGSNLTDSSIGISIHSVSLNNVISGNRMTNVSTGVFQTMETLNSTISENVIEGEHYCGLRLSGFNNTVCGNRIFAQPSHGDKAAIFLQDFINGNVCRNRVNGSRVGIWIGDWAESNTIVENAASFCSCGLHLTNLAIYNSVCGNNINGAELWSINSSASYNYLYHNNILAEKDKALRILDGSNFWDNGYASGGNYWSFLNFTDADLYGGANQNETGSDGILDRPFIIQASNVDHYPLAGSFNTFYAGRWNETKYDFGMISNSTITDFCFNLTAIPPTLSFNAKGPNGTDGFCRACIPTDVMWCDNLDQWIVMAGDQLIQQRRVTEEGGNAYIYFSYPGGNGTIRIQSVHAIPESPSLAVFLSLATAAVLAASIRNKKLGPLLLHLLRRSDTY